ncbi:hypothetical protein BD779DRAFT_1542158 [Infundibulicybe gibba]|nr:hypothetical protein BD779DRAFT_1542158 [Infundibulicybe gibba]
MIEQAENRNHRRTIMDVPAEVLLEIFTQCLVYEFVQGSDWYSSQANPTQEFNSYEAPLLLTKVCKFWRTMALSTQHLWTVLPHLGLGHISPGGGTDELFRMYLAHSGNAPLCILITVQTDMEVNDYTAALLSPTSVNMGEPSSDSLSRLFTDHRGMFKFLTHLQLISHSWTSTLESPCLNAFKNAPLLNSVCLSRRVNLPWSQIKHFRGYIPDIRDISNTLLPCTRLETLVISTTGFTDRVDRSGTQASVFLPRLRKLCLKDQQGTLDKFLNLLDAPRLEVIEINDIHRVSPVSSALIAYAIRSDCIGLTSLRLLCHHINANELRQLSKLIPGLRELDIFLTPDALRALMFSPTESNIFFHLARLTVHNVKVHEQELIDVCRSRFCSNSNGVEGEFQAELLQYCAIFPCITKYESPRAAQRLQDMAESFQDDADFQDILNRLWLLNRGVMINMDPDSIPEVSSKDLHDLGNCFDFLETYELNHPLLLERHRFKDIMNSFSHVNTKAPSHIWARASALLAKWEPLMREYGNRDARWSLHKRDGWNILVCCPNIKGRFESKFINQD